MEEIKINPLSETVFAQLAERLKDTEQQYAAEVEHSRGLAEQLATVRQWMAERAHDDQYGPVRDLSDRLLWADAPEPGIYDGPDMTTRRPSSGAIAVTASLFERVADLEQQMREHTERSATTDARVSAVLRLHDGDSTRISTLESELVKLGASVRDTNDAITDNNDRLRRVADMIPPEWHPDEGKYDDGRA